MKVNKLAQIFMFFAIFICSLLAIIFLVTNHIMLFLIAFGLCTYISLNKKIKHFPIILFITSIVIRLIVVLLLNFPQLTDFSILLEAAKSFAKGNFDFQNTSYFTTWAYQTGFVIYEGLVLKLFNNVLILKLLNIIYSSTLIVLIYQIGKKICTEKSARMASLLYMFFPFSIYMNTILANHHIATFLTYIGIFLLLKENKKLKHYILVAILISFGNIMRPEGIIIVFAFILYEIFKLQKGKIKQIIKYTSVFVVVYLVIGVSASLIITQTGINKQGLKNNNPEWKFVLGFNHDSCGYYNEEDTIYLSDRKKEREVIKERIMVNPIKMTQLMTCKIDNFWLQSDISVKHNMYITKKINILGMKINFMDIEKIFITFNKLLYLLTLFTCLTGVIYNRKKIIKSSAFFFIILMIVTFGVYLLIEIQPRYAYFIQVSIFILSTYGYDMLLNKVKAIYKNMKKKYKRSKKFIWIKYKV